MNLSQSSASLPVVGSGKKSTQLSKKVLNHNRQSGSGNAFESPIIPGERRSVQVGCVTEREAFKKRLESKKAAASRGKNAKRKKVQYAYVEYWFHWKEQNREGRWRCRSAYLGGHPKGRAPQGKLVARLDVVESQRRQNRPYGETLGLLGMADKI